MTYEINGKTVKIPDAEINKNIKVLGLTKEEAIQMWLDDEGYTTNEEQEELCRKSKENKIQHGAKSAAPRKKSTRERKPNERKIALIKILAEALETAGIEVNVTNSSKIIEFSFENFNYKLDLIEKRVKK